MKFRDCGHDLKIRGGENQTTSPKVTVILPTFARAHGLLQSSIDSVLSQSYDDFELIVVDDGSRDGTADVLDAYQKADPRVIVHSYRYNSGLPALRVNQAALHARGKYIAYQFDDDFWTEDSLKVRMEWLEKQSVPSVVYGRCEIHQIKTDGSIVRASLGRDFNYALLQHGNYIANNTVVHHASLFERHGMYDPHLVPRRYSDFDLWLRFGKTAPFHWVDTTCSIVQANLENSLGRDVVHDFTQMMKYVQLHRDHLLLPSYIYDYDLIGADHWGRRYSDLEKRQYYREVALPFLARHNDYASKAELAVAASGAMNHKSVLITKPDYSTSVDVTFRNFENLPDQHGFNSTFIKESDVQSFNSNGIDVAILYRTVGSPSLLRKLKQNKIPCAYLMDDNMLRFHESGPEHAFLAPGTLTHSNIVSQISEADAVIGYSNEIIEDFKEYNTRCIRLFTNIPAEFIGDQKISKSEKVKIAIFSSYFRKHILQKLWPAFQRIAKRNDVEFHFWGINPSDFPELGCDVYFKPFSHSYGHYLQSLKESCFDISLTPLGGETRTERSKSPVKLLESLVSGAVSVFSDVAPYAQLSDDVCVKVPNTTEAWAAAIESLITIGTSGRQNLLERSRNYVESVYTTESQYYDLFGALAATELHARLGQKSILYVFHEAALGGATLHLLRHAALTVSLGFSVVGLVRYNSRFCEEFRHRWREATHGADLLEDTWPSGGSMHKALEVRPRDETDVSAAIRLATCLQPYNVGLLHFTTWLPTMTELGLLLDVPVTASVHQYYPGADTQNFAHTVHCSSTLHGEQWKKMSGASVRRIVCPVDEAFFSIFSGKSSAGFSDGKRVRVLVSGTLQPRKNQMAALEAAAILRDRGVDIEMHVIGYDDLAGDYGKLCRDFVTEQGLDQSIVFHGFVSDPERFYSSCDMLLISALDESMPQTMLQAMASGVAVVSPAVGGVAELIKHRYNGMIARGASAEELASAVLEFLAYPQARREEMLRSAHRTISVLGRPSYVRAELMDLYEEAFRVWETRRRANDLQAKLGNRNEAVPIILPALGEQPAAPLAPMRALSLRSDPATASTISRLHSEVEAYHFSRPLRLARAVSWRKSKMWGMLSPFFVPLEQFNRKHFGRSRRDELRLSSDLATIPYREYVVHFRQLRLEAVHLGVVPLMAPAYGSIGLEIVSRDSRILCSTLGSIDGVDGNVPLKLSLATPLTDLEAGWRLRVFVRDVDTPVTIYEVVRSPALYGELMRFPFVKFD